jgi:type II secretory pathway pseudopilin PulG
MELLIVVALIMILSVIGIGSYTQAVVKSKDTQRKSDLSQMAKAAEAFNSDISRYPLSTTGEEYMHCYIKTSGVVTNPTCDSDKLYTRIDGSRTDYILMPSDPEPSQEYKYISEDGSTFAFYAALENKGDKDLLKLPDGSPNLDPWGISCGSAQCNYKITEVGLAKTDD